MRRFWGGTLCGIVLGTLLLGNASANSAEIMASPSWHNFFVDGQKVEMTAYNIGGNNYVKLRDIGEQVGFNVYWCDGVQVDSTSAYTGVAPAEDVTLSDEVLPEQDAAEEIDQKAAREQIVELTNAARKKAGRDAYATNQLLMKAAQVRAEEMAAATKYEHKRPDGSRFYTVTDCPYMAENIHRIATRKVAAEQKELAEIAVAEWMGSAGHEKNTLSDEFDAMGVGVAQGVNASGEEAWYCVQLFLYEGQSVTWVDDPILK